MSTVLWANVLEDLNVVSDECDKYALYKHSKKLDKLTKKLKTVGFASVQDTTDVQFNLSDQELPEGITSTDEVMSKEGVWVSGSEAVEMIEALIRHITDKNLRFGVFSDDSKEIIRELKESLKACSWLSRLRVKVGSLIFRLLCKLFNR